MIHSVYLQCLVLTLFSLTLGYQKTTQIPAGGVFPLNCEIDPESEDTEIRWRSENQQNLDNDSLPSGMKIVNRVLWFLPTHSSHSGTYSCYSWFNHSRELDAMNISIDVVNRKSSPKDIYRSRDRLGMLSCDHVSNIKQLDPNLHVSWTKNGIYFKEDSTLRFSSVQESDEGEYTCSVNFTYEGNVYTDVQTFRLHTQYEPIPQKPKVVKPQCEIHPVKVGSRHELNCKAFTGTDKDDPVDPTHLYWLMDGKHVKNSKDFVVNQSKEEGSTVYYITNLTILEVQTKFLNIPFMCVVLNSKGKDNGTVILVLAPDEDNWWVLPVAGCLFGALVLLVLYLFKVDLVLAYRKFSPCLKSQNDGKLYDGYVSYCHGNDQSMFFALRILPEVLEDHLGYKLFISGRNDLPGAAVHDVVAETVKNCRRLIIVLGSRASAGPTHSATVAFIQKEPADHLNNNKKTVYLPLSHLDQTTDLNLDPYEWSVGLYDALVKEGPRIILVQVGKEVDEANLPESLRYIRRTQGILRWKKDYTTRPSGRFWKQLHYRMPVVQKVNRSDVI